MLGIMPSHYYDGWGKAVTVVVDAALIAYFLGFKEIYILGVDLYYKDNANTHFYGKEESIYIDNKKPTRLISDALNITVKNLNKFFKHHSVKMVNLSKGYAHNDIFETGKLEELF